MLILLNRDTATSLYAIFMQRYKFQIHFSVWAMEQKYRKFGSQDVLIPWNRSVSSNSGKGGGSMKGGATAARSSSVLSAPTARLTPSSPKRDAHLPPRPMSGMATQSIAWQHLVVSDILAWKAFFLIMSGNRLSKIL